MTRNEYTVDELADVLLRAGFVECNIAACNCGSWHHRYGLPERFSEIKDALMDAGVLNNETGNLPIRAIAKLVEQRDALRSRLAEAERDAARYRFIKQWARRLDITGYSLTNNEHFEPRIDEAMAIASQPSSADVERRPCTCHPDDNPPVPCPRMYALQDCRRAAALRELQRESERLGLYGADQPSSAPAVACSECDGAGYLLNLSPAYPNAGREVPCPKCSTDQPHDPAAAKVLRENLHDLYMDGGTSDNGSAG